MAHAVPVVDHVADAVARVLGNGAGRVLVGFSGGLDSTVLLHAVARRVAGDRLLAVHVNHGLHADAPVWQANCERTAAALGVRCVVRQVAVSSRGSLEAAARNARYAVFAELMGAADDCLLLAHHRDDQVETMLLRLLQGRGLYGMPATRPLGAGRLARPFLDLPRAALAGYATRERLAWLEDPANADLRLDRNFVRHAVLPDLRARFPAFEAGLLELVAAQRARDSLDHGDEDPVFACTQLSLDTLRGIGPADRLVRLRRWLASRGRALPTRRALVVFLDQLNAGSDRRPRLELPQGRVERYRDRLWIVDAAPVLAPAYPVEAPGSVRLPHGELRIVTAAAGFTCSGTLRVGFRAGGERLLTGGRHRAVKELLYAAHVPPWMRGTYPLLFDDRGLVAVPGIALRDPVDEPLPRFAATWCAVE